MKKLIVANWKMNPKTDHEAIRLAKAADFSNVIIAPPFLFVSSLSRIIKKAALGSQDIFWENPPVGGGPYTGEISANQLKSFGVEYTIIGHSERRRWLQETDEMINKKVKTALEAGIKVILCVGEPFAARRKGIAAAKNFVKNQLIKDLAGLSNVKNIIIAYEPVWAIGTGRADKPEDTREMAKFIKDFLQPTTHLPQGDDPQPKVLYGGSVNSKNVGLFLKIKEIDGALVGGASLKTGEFKKIISLAQN